MCLQIIPVWKILLLKIFAVSYQKHPPFECIRVAMSACSEFACVSMSRHAVPSVCAQTTRMLPVTVTVLVVSDIASVMQPMPMFLVPVYTSQGTCGCWAYISICNHAWLVECGWSSAGLTTDPRKLVLATTGENWALEILSNDHIKNYFKMFHQALLLMDILEIVFCLSNSYHISISYEQQRLSAWLAAYLPTG